MSRSPQEVFSDHLAALSKRDVAVILEDYAKDAVLISPQGPLEGLAGVEAFFDHHRRDAVVGPIFAADEPDPGDIVLSSAEAMLRKAGV